MKNNKHFKQNQVGIDNPDHNTKLKFEQKTMGASSVAALLGFSPFKTAQEMCVEYQLEHSSHFNHNVATDLGTLLENYIWEKAQTLLPEKFPNIFKEDYSWIDCKEWEYRSLINEHITCNFDGLLIFENSKLTIPIELKRSAGYLKQGDFGGVNNYLFAQLQTQMFVAKSPFGFAVQLDPTTNKLECVMVKRDDEFINNMLFKINEFFFSNYNELNDYDYFTKKQKENIFNDDIDLLDDLIKDETIKKWAYEEAVKKVDAQLDKIGNIEFRSKYYTKSKKTKKKEVITNSESLGKALNGGDVDYQMNIKLKTKELKNIYPSLYDEYIEIIEEDVYNGRRNTKGVTI